MTGTIGGMAEPEKPPKPGPNRKRQLAGVLLLLLAFYPFSYGAFGYACGRGWVPRWAIGVGFLFYEPANRALNLVPTEDGLTLGSYWRLWGMRCVLRGQDDTKRP